MRRSRPSPRKILAVRLATLVGIALLWEAAARSGLFYKDVVPSLHAVARALLRQIGGAELYHNLTVTGLEVVAGFVIAFTFGVAFGILFGARRFLGRIMEPYINALATTPKIVFLPVVMLMVGIGPESKTALGALSGFFPIVLSTSAGMLRIRPVFILVGRSFNLRPQLMVTKIYLPSLVQPIVTGMRLGLGVTIIGVLLAEVKFSNKGLGFLAIDFYNQFRIPDLYALLIIIFALAVAANALMTLAADRLKKGGNE